MTTDIIIFFSVLFVIFIASTIPEFQSEEPVFKEEDWYIEDSEEAEEYVAEARDTEEEHPVIYH